MDTDTPPSRLKKAREAVRLDQHTVAALIGINTPSYYDLEAYDDELAATLSLEDLCRLADVVRADPLVLLLGADAGSVECSITFRGVVWTLAARMEASGLDARQFGEQVGWDLTKILSDSDELWALNTDGFRDVAKAAGIEWTSAFPRRRRAAPDPEQHGVLALREAR